MKLKKLVTFVITAALTLTALPVYAEESTEPVKYEKELYYIDVDIPAQPYMLITKDITKPSYVGIYKNQKEAYVEFKKNKQLLFGTSEDYVYPHYFENNKFYNGDDSSVPTNQGTCIYSSYFENSQYLNLRGYDDDDARIDFLYLENCYAVPAQDLDKVGVDFNKDGYAPISGYLTKGGTYQLEVNENEKNGFLAFYKYDKVRHTILFIKSYVLLNKQYPVYDSDLLYGKQTVTVPEDADLVLKVGMNINDAGGNPLYTQEGIAFPDNFTEKYDFKDVNTTLKTITVENFKALKEKEIAIKKSDAAFVKTPTELAIDRRNVFKSFDKLAKTEADYEYIKYVREIYVMYSQSSYIDRMVSKYLNNAASFEDLSKLLRLVAYDIYRPY